MFHWNRWRNELIKQKALVPVLKLATLMLFSPASQRFIYSLVDTESHTLMGSEIKDDKVVYHCHFRKSTAPDSLIENEVKSTLDSLATHITFEFRSKLQNGRRCLAETHLKKAEVYIRPKGLRDTFESITEDGRKIKPTTAEISRARFVLATTFCHEVMHAIHTTVLAKCNHGTDCHVNHYFESQTEAEVGYAWEMEVLGGVRIGCDTTENDVDIIPRLDQSLEELDFDGGQHLYARTPTTSILGYMTRIQQPKFWEASRTPTMLHIPTKPKRSVPKLGQNQRVSRTEANSSESRAIDVRQVLKARAKRNELLKTSLSAERSGTASEEQVEDLETHRQCLVQRKERAALIGRIVVRQAIRNESTGLSATKNKDKNEADVDDTEEDVDHADEMDVDQSDDNEDVDVEIDDDGNIREILCGIEGARVTFQRELNKALENGLQDEDFHC
ncbi:MAG: hypothetical protein Q9168_007770 [Polycauliona sp. 1 TL-2023]